MRSLKLHFKTTLLVSAITLAVMSTLLLVISARLIDLLRADEVALMEIEATRLAEHLAQLPSMTNVIELERATGLVSAARPEIVSIRIWEREGHGFTAKWSTTGNKERTELPAPIAEMLSHNQLAWIENERVIETSDPLYRLCAPIARNGQVIGAVEISNHLDNLPKILKRSVGTMLLLALIAVGLITLATYFLFRNLVYRPIGNLLEVIMQAKSGKLNVQVPQSKPDELGLLSQEFNSLMERLHEMTAERERQQGQLRERVREATAQLEQRNEQLAAANLELWSTTRRLTQLERLAAAGQTAAQFAHEVGTPLNLISCHAQLIQTDLETDPAAVDERAQIIIEQTERIERTVRGMLDRTRAERAEFSPLDLNALIRRTTEATAPTLAERKVQLQLSCAERLPLIAGDADKLQQVFINLINNALDAMPDGGQLMITTEPAEITNGGPPQVAVYLADTGCGMTVEVQAHIFDPLYTTKEGGKGTGLGLVVVNQVMKEHSGAVEVESASGRGSRFRLSFPAAAHGSAVKTEAINETYSSRG